MAEITSYNISMTTSPSPRSPPLGSLSRLPPELRTMVYNEALKAGTLPSLMRTSRTVYNEVKPRLYDTLDIHIHPDAASPYIGITIRKLSIFSSSLTWSIPDEPTAKTSTGILARLPYKHFTTTRLNIYAFDPKKRGQLLYLFSKVDDMVHAMCRRRDRSGLKYIFNFAPYKGHTWATAQDAAKEHAFASMQRYGDSCAVLPFLRCRQTPRWDSDFFVILFSKLSEKKRPVRLSGGSVHDVDQLLQDIGIWFHIELDRARGLEAEEIKTRRMTNRVLEYVCRGGGWPWAKSGEFMGTTGNELPRVMRELLGLRKDHHLWVE